MNAIKRCSLFVSIYRCDVMMMEASMAGENVSIHNSMVVKNHWAWALLVLVLRLFEFARVFHLKQKVNWTIHDISASTLMASNDCLCVLMRFTTFTQNAAVLPRKQVSFSQAAILLMKNSLLLPSYSSSSAFHISFALYDHSEHHSAVFFLLRWNMLKWIFDSCPRAPHSLITAFWAFETARTWNGNYEENSLNILWVERCDSATMVCEGKWTSFGERREIFNLTKVYFY